MSSAKTRERPLPPQLQKMLNFIKSEIAAGRRFPAATTVRDHMGWKNVCHDALRSLVIRGHLKMRHTEGQRRYAYELVEPAARSAAEAPGAEGVTS